MRYIVKIDQAKLETAIRGVGMSFRTFYGSFGGKRRVAAWSKGINPRYMGRVAQVLKCTLESLCIDESTKTVAQAETVEVKVEAPIVQAKPKKKSPSQMNKEELIVLAHQLDPEIDLPDKATKKELLKIVKGLK